MTLTKKLILGTACALVFAGSTYTGIKSFNELSKMSPEVHRLNEINLELGETRKPYELFPQKLYKLDEVIPNIRELSQRYDNFLQESESKLESEYSYLISQPQIKQEKERQDKNKNYLLLSMWGVILSGGVALKLGELEIQKYLEKRKKNPTKLL